jgi:hypothetical protein
MVALIRFYVPTLIFSPVSSTSRKDEFETGRDDLPVKLQQRLPAELIREGERSRRMWKKGMIAGCSALAGKLTISSDWNTRESAALLLVFACTPTIGSLWLHDFYKSLADHGKEGIRNHLSSLVDDIPAVTGGFAAGYLTG